MTAKIIAWARTENDTRHTASSTAEFACHGSALAIARRIDECGQSAVNDAIAAGMLTPAAHNRPGIRVAAGHGVLIVYAKGRKRSVVTR